MTGYQTDFQYLTNGVSRLVAGLVVGDGSLYIYPKSITNLQYSVFNLRELLINEYIFYLHKMNTIILDLPTQRILRTYRKKAKCRYNRMNPKTVSGESIIMHDYPNIFSTSIYSEK
jgi:hypothetical protein